MVSWNTITSNKFNKNTLFILAEKGLTLPLNFITFVVLAREFGPSEFGLISLGLSLVALFAPFSKLAYETIITRYLSLGYSFSRLFKEALWLRVSGSLLVFVLLMATVFFTMENTALLFFIGLVGITIFIDAFTIYDSFFQSILRSKYTSYSRSISLLIGCLLRIAIAIYFQDIILIALSFILERLLAIFLLRYYFLKLPNADEGSVTSQISAKILFKESLPLILTNVLILINFKIDQVLIEYFIGTEAVGVYASAVRFSEVWYMLPVALMTSYFPFISKNIIDEAQVHKVVLKLTRYLIFSALGIALITNFASSILINTLLGASYHQAAAVLGLHIWASVFFFAGHPISKVLIAKNKTWINFAGKMIAALLNVALNIWMIPVYGINGAAMASLISYAIGYYFYYFLFRETRFLIWKITIGPVQAVYDGIIRLIRSIQENWGRKPG